MSLDEHLILRTTHSLVFIKYIFLKQLSKTCNRRNNLCQNSSVNSSLHCDFELCKRNSPICVWRLLLS